MATYNIKIQQTSGTSSNLYRPETAAKYCYVSSDVASLFGYSKETPIEDIISLNAQDNLYWWEKKTSSWTGSLGTTQTYQLYTGSSRSSTQEIQYSSSYAIDSSTGKTSLSGTITKMKAGGENIPSVSELTNKYVWYSRTGETTGNQVVFQVLSSSTIEVDYTGSSNKKFYVYFKNIKPVLSQSLVSIDYLNSSNTSSYPIYSKSNGVTYRYLGQPSNLFKKTAKIIQGCYTGTGVGNATITFEYQPLIVFFGNGYMPITTSSPESTNYYYSVPNSSTSLTYWGNTLSFSSSTPAITIGLNTAGTVYYYTAIC